VIWIALALAAQGAAAKLIVMPPGQPALVIPYPTMERCERARAALHRQVEQEKISKDEAAELARQLGRPVLIEGGPRGYCVPG